MPLHERHTFTPPHNLDQSEKPTQKPYFLHNGLTRKTLQTRLAAHRLPLQTRTTKPHRIHETVTTERTYSEPHAGRTTKHAEIFMGNCIRTKFADTNTTHADFQEKEKETHIPGMNRTRKPPENLRDTIKKHEKTRRRNTELRTR